MGAIPFIALAPPVCKHLAPVLPTSCVENCGMFQVGVCFERVWCLVCSVDRQMCDNSQAGCCRKQQVSGHHLKRALVLQQNFTCSHS